ncbi:transmembrane protein, putative [Medicago truncatula]|uniref:Transmembrane protein, putative n=1 Tax=Medicago truncatula TaxID=3880 RepID=A0A072UHD2_MEDTR|nr:transmembrane protein, putative [Medicago truncatula]
MDACNDHIVLDLEEPEDVKDVSLSVCRIRKRRLRVAMRVNQRKLKLVNCLSRQKYYNQARLPTTLKDQDFIPSIPCHAIFVFLDTILIGVLQLQYQNKKESPFDDHKVHMQTFLTSICIYCSLIGIKIYTKTRGCHQEQILSFALLLFGILSSASLLSILLPRQLFWVVLFVWGSIPVILARHSIKILVCRIIEVMVVKITTMVLIFNTKDSASGSNKATYPNPANLVEGRS